MADQLRLGFEASEPETPTLPITFGGAEITEWDASSILTKATGFMSAYDYTLNPYGGCSYGCNYCYAAFFVREPERQAAWGDWVQVKRNALERLRRMRSDLQGKSVYMSSVTDPYQPVERKLKLVRSLLPVLAERGVRLVVQTRSPLVTRDIDVFHRFEAVRINMTVTTDNDTVRRAFEPKCPTTSLRLSAIAQVAEAGVPAAITLTPLLPLDDPTSFAEQLLATGVTDFVVQPFHADRGRFVAGTGQAARRLSAERGWDEHRYLEAVAAMRAVLPQLTEGRDGFAPI